MEDLRVQQDEQFRKISQNYEKMEDRVGAAVYNTMRSHLYFRLEGKSVLDVGNGGHDANIVFGKDLAEKIPFFVGLDPSYDMLTRNKTSYLRVQADGRHLPFKDKSFDHVILNGVLHHLGYTYGDDIEEGLGKFILELKRVSRGEILVYEIFLPKILETVEKGVCRAVKRMPTFVLSEATLDRALRRVGLERKEVVTKTLADMTSPFYWYLLVLDYPFLKLPAVLSPFKHSFFTL